MRCNARSIRIGSYKRKDDFTAPPDDRPEIELSSITALYHFRTVPSARQTALCPVASTIAAYHADQLSKPVTFFQGIVPPNQAETTFPQRLGEVEADILTGSQPDGSAFQPDKDMTCKNWTSSARGL